MKFAQFDFPTTVIVFGVTGDLSRKKLLPALFDMYKKDYLPSAFRVVGFSRNNWSDSDFQAFVREALQQKIGDRTEEKFDAFLGLFHHAQGTFEDASSYQNLSKLLLDIDNTVGQCMNKLFYLAVPPIAYKTIFHHIADSDLTVPCSTGVGWTRVLVEKPFGRDLETAQELDALLGNLFQENQIFRIDHYLAKEALQNILAFRFSNSIFEPIWNNQRIEKVEIKLWEDIDIAARGSFYNDVGALRDVGQNHILQMLSLIAMEHPGSLDADAIRARRVEVIRQLHLAGESILDGAKRGQYKGFIGSSGVPDDSETETYFKLKTYIKNDRWDGVPFYLESGKALSERKVEVIVTFKEVQPCFCQKDHVEHSHQNTITFGIQPEEKITVRFWSKQPGIVSDVIPQDLSFDYSIGAGEEIRTDAYEKVLFDCIAGDQTLFASTDEVTSSWAFITPILKRWHIVPLEVYDRGSSGPKNTFE